MKQSNFHPPNPRQNCPVHLAVAKFSFYSRLKICTESSTHRELPNFGHRNCTLRHASRTGAGNRGVGITTAAAWTKPSDSAGCVKLCLQHVRNLGHCLKLFEVDSCLIVAVASCRCRACNVMQLALFGLGTSENNEAEN